MYGQYLLWMLASLCEEMIIFVKVNHNRYTKSDLNMKRTLSIIILLVLAAVASAQVAPKRYGLKSGTVKYNASVMGQAVGMVSYFDNYGALEAYVIDANIPDMGYIQGALVIRDGSVYIAAPAANFFRQEPAPEMVDFRNLTEDAVAKYKVSNLGEDNVCGKDCVKYAFDIPVQGQSIRATASVWNGLILKLYTVVSGMDVDLKAVELKENVEIPESTFDVSGF